MVKFTLYSDGASRGNPGPASCAAILYAGDDKTPLLQEGRSLGRTTNNVAEYNGVILGLELLTGHLTKEQILPSAVELNIRLDSELIVNQLLGKYKVKHESMKPLFEKVRSILASFQSLQIEHIRREFNKEADRLANQVLDSQV